MHLALASVQVGRSSDEDNISTNSIVGQTGTTGICKTCINKTYSFGLSRLLTLLICRYVKESVSFIFSRDYERQEFRLSPSEFSL